MVASSYRGKNAVVTGGLGFIGSNLVLRLVDLGARVTVVDSRVPCCGANPYNIRAAGDGVGVLVKDIADAADFRKVLASADVIFNLAGEVSHVHSMLFPERDAALNGTAQMRFVQECARVAPGVRIVYAGTRQIYGRPLYLPVDEKHPVHPVDINGIHKHAAVMYHLIFARAGALDPIVINLTNVYGPRMALSVPCQGVLGTFIRRLLLRQPLEILGDGRQLRDPLYVDDAVEAFLAAGCAPEGHSQVYNVGGPAALELSEIAGIASRAAAAPPPVFRPFPPEKRQIDIGSYYADSGLIAEELGWRPRTGFQRGIANTLDFYRAELSHYLDPGRPEARCQLLEPAAPLEQRRAAQ